VDFYVPNYLETDFDSMSEVLGEECTLNYNATTPTVINAFITQLDFKSNMKGLSDSTTDIKISKSVSVKKGDYITDSTENVWLVNWNPFKDVNCYHAQMQLCTSCLDIETYYEQEISSLGVAEATPTTPCGYFDIASDVYGYVQRVGMSKYDGTVDVPGIFQSQRIAFVTQYNDDTALIEIEHEFAYQGVQYLITDIDYSQLSPSRTSGIIFFYSQVKEGGRVA